MPIITSSVPQMNSAVNVNETNRKIITQRFVEARKIVEDIYDDTRYFIPTTFNLHLKLTFFQNLDRPVSPKAIFSRV